MFFTGIDQHRLRSTLTTFTATGDQVGEATLPNDRATLVHYFARFPGPHQAVVEATGRWYWLRDMLVPAGIDLRLAHAKFLKAIAYAKVKTDAIDATTLGRLLRTGLIPEAHMIRDELRGPRDVLRARLRMVTRRSSAKNSLDRLLEKWNVPRVADRPPLYQVQAAAQTALISVLTEQIHALEVSVRPALFESPAVQRLLWIPGIAG